MTDDAATPQGALFHWFYEDIADSEDATTLAHDAIVALSAAGFEVLPRALVDAVCGNAYSGGWPLEHAAAELSIYRERESS